MKPELRLRERGINSTVVLFGGARIPEPGKDAWAAANETQKKNLEAASNYYEEARVFAQYASLTSKALGFKDYVVVTGGGPGVMEAGNRGAADVGAPSVGLNIVLPHEQAPNLFVTPDLSFNFHYFATRKIHFLLRARAVAIFPGGFGTLDEFFETLTLIQTGRMERIPLLLFGIEFWNKVINFQALADAGTIGPDDPQAVHRRRLSRGGLGRDPRALQPARDHARRAGLVGSGGSRGLRSLQGDQLGLLTDALVAAVLAVTVLLVARPPANAAVLLPRPVADALASAAVQHETVGLVVIERIAHPIARPVAPGFVGRAELEPNRVGMVAGHPEGDGFGLRRRRQQREQGKQGTAEKNLHVTPLRFLPGRYQRVAIPNRRNRHVRAGR